MGELEDKLQGILNNPQEMEKIMALARNMMGGAGGTASAPVGETSSAPPGEGLNLEGVLGGLDPKLLGKLTAGLSSGVGSAALLQAVTPHLKEERRGQLKRAITIAQMVRAARVMFD